MVVSQFTGAVLAYDFCLARLPVMNKDVCDIILSALRQIAGP
jgi:hypothetical protein